MWTPLQRYGIGAAVEGLADRVGEQPAKRCSEQEPGRFEGVAEQFPHVIIVEAICLYLVSSTFPGVSHSLSVIVGRVGTATSACRRNHPDN
jgi:hypothetical protein